MSGNAYYRFVPKESTRSLGWEIPLAEMNTVSFKSQRNIYSIVYHNPHATLTGDD